MANLFGSQSTLGSSSLGASSSGLGQFGTGIGQGLRPTAVGGGSSISIETQYYLNNLERRIVSVTQSDQSSDFFAFTLSSSTPEAAKPGGLASLGQTAPLIPALQANAAMEKEVSSTNDSKLISRFAKAKSENPDLSSIYILPIKGFAGLRQRNQNLKERIQVLDNQAERMASITKQHKARICTAKQQIQRIKKMDSTLRHQLIYVAKLLEANARSFGNFELNPVVMRENEIMLEHLESSFKIGTLDNEVNILEGMVRKLQDPGFDAQDSKDDIAFSESAISGINQVLLHQKKSIQSISENLRKLEPFVTSIEASVKR